MPTEQMSAIRGGRRIRSSYLPTITAEAARLPEMYRLREERKYREDLAGQRERELGLMEEGQKLQEKQAKIATGVSALQVGATGYMARKMITGTPAATTTTTGTEMAPLTAGSEYGGAETGTGVSGYQYGGAAVGGYVAGRYVGKPVGEKHIPKSLVKGGRSRGRYGGMMAGAVAGGLIAGPPGAVIGGIAGLIGAW